MTLLALSASPAVATYIFEPRDGTPVTVSYGPRAMTRADLEAKDTVIARHLLRLRREKFRAEARGDSPRQLQRLARELERTQRRRLEVIRQIDRLGPED